MRRENNEDLSKIKSRLVGESTRKKMGKFYQHEHGHANKEMYIFKYRNKY